MALAMVIFRRVLLEEPEGLGVVVNMAGLVDLHQHPRLVKVMLVELAALLLRTMVPVVVVAQAEPEVLEQVQQVVMAAPVQLPPYLVRL